MDYSDVRYQIAGRIVLLILTIFILTSVSGASSYTILQIILVGAIAYQGYQLYHMMERSNREIINFLQSIKWDDFSHTYPEKHGDSSLGLLYKEFNTVMRKFREIRAEKEAQYQYLKTIVQHVGIGIITFDPAGEVQIVNSAAKSLLGIKHLTNIRQLKKISSDLINSLENLKTGGRDLVKINKTDEEEIQLAIFAIELSLQGKQFKLVSLQNIQSELEEKEMEAWQNLIRVLTHEIMNSVTPISSLARTIESAMEEWLENGQDINEIGNDQIEDFHMALHTIHRRSESLIKFVSDFRNMTHITLPQLSEICVKEMVDHVLVLLKTDISSADIRITTEIPDDLCIKIDEQQIEQVLINIVKNAIQALEEYEESTEEKALFIKAGRHSEGGSYIIVKDNGPGIDEEALKKIFIPFFTTKKSGSGIGLSLSKQIMRNHRGSISAKSVIDEGTEFALRFGSGA